MRSILLLEALPPVAQPCKSLRWWVVPFPSKTFLVSHPLHTCNHVSPPACPLSPLFFVAYHCDIQQALDGPRAASPSAADAARRLLDAGVMRQGSNLRVMAMGVCGAAFVTAVSGAFVAGNDAGRCYNCFPKMTEEDWLPEEVTSFLFFAFHSSPFFSFFSFPSSSLFTVSACPLASILKYC